MKTTNSVEAYILQNQRWQEALIMLHEIITSTGLSESIKWGAPVYTLNNKNIVGMAAFKNHFSLWFYQGVFLRDKHKVLMNAQEGITKALRQMRFSSVQDINAEVVRAYVMEAIENQKAGKEFKPTRITKVIIPKELKDAFEADPEIEICFKKLSPSKQYDFTWYIATAKREETRIKRVDKIIPIILAKRGLNDEYRL